MIHLSQNSQHPFKVSLLICFCASTSIFCSGTPHDNFYPDIIHRALEWQSSLGANLSGITASKKGRGLQSLIKYSSGDVLGKLTSEGLINEVKATKSPLYKHYQGLFPDSFLERDKFLYQACHQVAMFIFLENTRAETREASSFYPYYLTLPHYDHDFNVPHLFWRDNEGIEKNSGRRNPLDVLLNPTRLNYGENYSLTQYQNRIVNYSEEGKFFHRLSQDTGLAYNELKKRYRWAMSVVATRSWTAVNISVMGKCTLVPIMDMINHEDGGMVLAGENNGSIYFVIRNETAPGSELIGDYDPEKKKCAEDMLFVYGFMPKYDPKSRSYCVTVSAKLHHSEDMSLEYKMLQRSLLQKVFPEIVVDLKEENIDSDIEFTLTLKDRKNFPAEMLASYRLFSADASTLDSMRNEENPFMEPVNLLNEHRALKKIRDFLSSILAEFDGSDHEDKEELKHFQNISENSRQNECSTSKLPDLCLQNSGMKKHAERMVHALHVRIHRRKILVDSIAHIERKWLEILSIDVA